MVVHCKTLGGTIHKDSNMNDIPGVVQYTTCTTVQGSPIKIAFPVPNFHASPLPSLPFISPHISSQVFVSNPDGSPAYNVLVYCQNHKVRTLPNGVAALTINTDANMEKLPILVPT